ncbi:protein of unknown function [Myxococcus fulvus]|uniref:DUF4178 domain-containing protein n=1 Tax=Myxococcus fulvus TaxID=33 RepID=A0A511SVC2_MYXFU|nr:DUF4178 domain-containing protein [Myxococcus fulvus]GEN05263.1 hypothetical protein MFU01_03000 [Myxococcus fulvus]SET13161.1 protein of unknown function [Myxococcus fulvus]
MSQGRCPSCGADVEFTAGSAQVVVCGHCQTVVARKGDDFESHGKIGRIVPTDSPLQLGAEGRYARSAFRVVGHLQKDHGAGPWDEWYVEFDDGRAAWMSESEGAFHLLLDGGVEEGLQLEDMHPGQRLKLRNRVWVVEERGHGTVVAAEGQLPSDVDPTQDSYYVDATGSNGAFLTLDFGTRGRDPEVFIGERLKLEQLGIPSDQLRPRARRKVDLQQARCTECNGPLELRAPDQSLRVACPFCGALLDVRKGKLSFLRLLEKPDHPPLIPLGAKGTLKNTEWMCIGFLVRSCTVEGVRYPWEEYLLYHRAKGFVWLMNSNGHWVFLEPVAAGDVSLAPLTSAFFDKRRYKAFQNVHAVTETVQGEFYWKVQAGESAEATEYVNPPYSLNVDATEDEVTYTHGEYLAPEVIQKAFNLERLPAPEGIQPSQPNPFSQRMKSTFLWSFIWFLGLVVLSGLFSISSLNRVVLETGVKLPAEAVSNTPSATRFSEPFELTKRGNVKVELSSGLGNSWIGVQGDLVNQDTGDVTTFYQELSYYFGQDSDGSWSEGSPSETLYLSTLPAGKYVLRTTASFDASPRPVDRGYHVKLIHDSPNGSWFCVALVLMLLGPVFAFFRSHNFETRRWADSNLGNH